MAFYRQIYSTFWTDPKIDDDFSPEDKYFYLYLLTNAHTNACGCYEISMKQFTRELGYNEDTVRLLIKRMEESHKVIRYSQETKEVLLLNWSKYNWSASPNFIIGIEECIPYIKNEEFKEYVIGKLEVHKIHAEEKKKNTVAGKKNRQSTTVDDSMPTSVSVSASVYDLVAEVEEKEMEVKGEEEKQKPPKEEALRNKIPPSVEEVSEYCRQRGNGIDPEYFCDYYTRNGWMVSKYNKMKDWQATVRTWEKKEKEQGNGVRENQRGRYGSGYRQNTEHSTDFSRIRPSLDPDDYPDSCRVGA